MRKEIVKKRKMKMRMRIKVRRMRVTMRKGNKKEKSQVLQKRKKVQKRNSHVINLLAKLIARKNNQMQRKARTRS